MAKQMRNKWPKERITLSEQEKLAREKILLEFQEWCYKGFQGWLHRLGHKYIEKISRLNGNNIISLEIGCGSGYHFNYIKRNQLNIGLDISYPHICRASMRFKAEKDVFLVGDAYALPFKSNSIDRVISVYNFEHLNNLPKCLSEIKRILKPMGELIVALPAEGGVMYRIGRRLISDRYFKEKYNVNYMKLIKYEHINTCAEILECLENFFKHDKTLYLPIYIPSIHFCFAIVARYTTRR